mgnify:CR=1 FL=1
MSDMVRCKGGLRRQFDSRVWSPFAVWHWGSAWGSTSCTPRLPNRQIALAHEVLMQALSVVRQISGAWGCTQDCRQKWSASDQPNRQRLSAWSSVDRIYLHVHASQICRRQNLGAWVLYSAILCKTKLSIDSETYKIVRLVHTFPVVDRLGVLKVDLVDRMWMLEIKRG